MTPPPVGSPNYFVGSEDNNGPLGAPQDALTLWKFHYDPVTPGNSSFMLTNTLPTQPFNSILGLCGGTRNCIPQPGTTNGSITWAIDNAPCSALLIAILALTSHL